MLSTLATLVLGALFVSLGSWQMQRAAEKEDVLARQSRSEAEAALRIEGHDSAEFLHLRKVEVICEPDFERQLLLDNRVRQQRVGYHVLVPCVFANGLGVLLNRGWTLSQQTRDSLPEVSYSGPARARLGGTFAVPGVGVRLGQMLDAQHIGWPKRIQFYDFEAISSLLDLPLLAGIVHLEESQPETLAFDWSPVAFGPEKHYAYAAQWFGFLIVLLILYVGLNFRKNGSGADDE